VIEHWPDQEAPIVFSGYEIGSTINTGKLYRDLPNSPMRRCYELAYNSLEKGRASWDQTTILHAVRGLQHAGVTYWSTVTGGNNVIDEQGGNRWEAAPLRQHSYLVRSLPDKAMAELLDRLMVQPAKGK
jgi:hypothetical protein